MFVCKYNHWSSRYITLDDLRKENYIIKKQLMILKKSKQNTLGVYLYKSVISLSLLLLHGFTFVIFIVSLSFPYYLPVKKDLENNY